MPEKQIRLEGTECWRLSPREQGEERGRLGSGRQSAFRLGHNARLKSELCLKEGTLRETQSVCFDRLSSHLDSHLPL